MWSSLSHFSLIINHQPISCISYPFLLISVSQNVFCPSLWNDTAVRMINRANSPYSLLWIRSGFIVVYNSMTSPLAPTWSKQQEVASANWQPSQSGRKVGNHIVDLRVVACSSMASVSVSLILPANHLAPMQLTSFFSLFLSKFNSLSLFLYFSVFICRLPLAFCVFNCLILIHY